MDARTAERLAANERRFREVNERLEADVRRVAEDDDEETIAFVCECSRMSCRETVGLTLPQYRGVRGDEERFVLVPGHEIPEVERVVAREPGYVVVEKLED